jgi:hypothetical protein
MMKMRGMHWILPVILALVSPSLVGAATHEVACDQGGTIAQALAVAAPGDTIVVTGTCNEEVTITTDRITLDGQGSAMLQGSGDGQTGSVSQGLITIAGAQGVVITGFTVQNAPVDGILGQRGVAFEVLNTTIQDGGDDGFEIGESSTARLAECMILRSGGDGINTVFNSYMRIDGNVSISESTGFGIVIYGGSSSSMTGDGVSVTTYANGIDGILVAENAMLRAQGGVALTASQNGRDGIHAVANATFSIAGATVTFAENTQNGLSVSVQSEVIKLPPGTITIQNNAGAGLVGDISSVVSLSGGTTITDNGPGDAGPDLDLHFGTAAAIAGDNTLGSIVCDATVLLRGSDITCPAP